jgi:OmpA-OmpF porin, OOP family
MKIRTIVLAGVAALVLAGPVRASDATGWYLGVAGGWDQLNNIDFRTTTGGVTTDDRAKTDGSYLLTLTSGYRFQNRLRLELEAGYSPHDFRSEDFGGTVYGGHARVGSGLVNLVYDIPLSNRFDFSIGGGAGIGNANIDEHDGPVALADGSRMGFMWQGLAGFSYSLTPRVDLTLDWRYRSLMERKDYPTSFAPGTTVNVASPNDQAVMIGLRWYTEPTYLPPAPPPPPPPPPPPAPPAPPPVKTFIVFFDFNKSDLTAEALGVVQEAVKTAKEAGAVRVLVTGHTDTVGSDSYNQGLSVRRAEAVKDEMLREGMADSSIAIEGKSFHDPLVATGPGVREPQNRRAVIDLGG